ncbi:DUF3592 domain-containing protein [Arthrobacter zhaoxinii]|uniref:DUF3592 domain-containing protein n=1 Tax=Arthrobacter zhaoxinii TaxID=2964616 RepID=A0ABY5YUZ9_9MICC|nr:DUF3592 domain-containing protein [Arthrobacter zhaoxinii]UWX98056.1 DUF3592 domain-containing protein [Arthrobacter zhaoxinii]
MAAGFTKRRRRGTLSVPPRTPKQQPPLVIFLSGLGCLAMAVLGLSVFVPAVEGDRHVTHIGIRTEGIVERVYTERHGRRSGRIVTYAEVRYAGPEGSARTMDSRVRKGWKMFGTQPPEAVKGERVTVLYNPEDGDHAVVDGWQRTYGFRGGMVWLLAFMGVTVLVAVPVQEVRKLRRRRTQRQGQAAR